jgi:hypothetical protein
MERPHAALVGNVDVQANGWRVLVVAHQHLIDGSLVALPHRLPEGSKLIRIGLVLVALALGLGLGLGLGPALGLSSRRGRLLRVLEALGGVRLVAH